MGRTKQPVKKQKTSKKDPDNFIPTGSTMLNLALSDIPNGGWRLGKVFNLIGDSSTGKTLLALTTLAEMCQQSRFDDYRLIFDDVEYGCGFDIRNLSEKLAERIEPPRLTEDGEPFYSDTIEDLHDNVLSAIESGKPFVYIADSWDALDAEDDQKKINEAREARRKGSKSKGTFGMAKPKKTSQILRNIKARIDETKSIVIIISQTRDNIDPFSFEEKTRAGGRALKFYSWVELWLSFKGKIKSKEIQIGGNSQVNITKNRTTGKKRKIPMAIYDEIGVDDLGPMLDFLVEHGEEWSSVKSTGVIIPPKRFLDGEKMSKSRLVRMIESQNLEEALRDHCHMAWSHLEESLKLNRKKRYA